MPASLTGSGANELQPRKDWRQAVIAIAGLQIVAGGVSAPPALHLHPMSRTITDGVLARVGGGYAEAA
jgi:hypothetical protein